MKRKWAEKLQQAFSIILKRTGFKRSFVLMVFAISCAGLLQTGGDKIKKASVAIEMDARVADPNTLTVNVDISIEATSNDALIGVYFLIEESPTLGSALNIQPQNNKSSAWTYATLGEPLGMEMGKDPNTGKSVKIYSYALTVSGFTLADNTNYRIWMKAVNAKGKVSQLPGHKDFETDFTGPEITFAGRTDVSNDIYLDWTLTDADSGVAANTLQIFAQDLDGAGGFNNAAPLNPVLGLSGSLADPALDALLLTAPESLRQYTLNVLDNLGNVGTRTITYPGQKINSLSADVNAAPVGVTPLSFKTAETVTVRFRGTSFGSNPTLMVREGLEMALAPLTPTSQATIGAEREITYDFSLPHTYFAQRLIDNCSGTSCPPSILQASLTFTLQRAEDSEQLDYTASAVQVNLDDTYDSDGDGVADVYEIILHGTDPNDPTMQISKSTSTIGVDCGLPAAGAGSLSAAQVYRSGATIRNCAVIVTARDQLGNPLGTFPDGQVTFALGGGAAIGTLVQPAANNSTGSLVVASAIGATEIQNTITGSWVADGGGSSFNFASAAPTVTVRPTPVCSITLGPTEGAWYNNASQNFGFVCNTANPLTVHDIQQLECRKDGAVTAPCTSLHNWAALTDAAHTFEIAARDIDGTLTPWVTRNFHTDRSLPSAIITANPTSPAGVSASHFDYSYSDVGAHDSGLQRFECEIDGGGFSTCPNSPPGFDIALPDGPHTFKVRAVDQAGNVTAGGSEATWSWSIDTTAPVCTITNVNPAPMAWRNQVSETFTYTCTDATTAITSVECQLIGSGTTNIPCTIDGAGNGNVTFGIPSSTAYTFQIRATDTIGTTSAWVTRNWMSDIDAPAAPNLVGGGPPDPSNSANPTFTWGAAGDTGGSPGVTYLCSLNGGAFTPCASGVSPGPLSEGNQTFVVRSVDTAGNTTDSATYNWRYDASNPTCSITLGSSPATWTNVASPHSVAFSCDDTHSVAVTVECSVNGGAYGACSSFTEPNGTMSGIVTAVNGAYSMSVRATDWVGKVSAVATHNWNVDRTAPPAVTLSGPASWTNSTTANFSWLAVNDSGTGGSPGIAYTCSLDGGAFGACTSSTTHTAGPGLSSAAHTMVVRTTDTAGNTTNSTTYNWTVDTVNPVCSVTGGPSGWLNSGHAASQGITHGCTDSQGTVGVTCALTIGGVNSPAAITGCTTTTATINTASNGAYVFTMTGTDQAGNTHQATRSWSVDRTAPTTPVLGTHLTAYPTNGGNSGAFSWSGLSDSGGSGVAGAYYRLDGAGYTYVAGTSGAPNYGTLNGAHTFNLYVVDVAGNVSGTLTHSWTGCSVTHGGWSGWVTTGICSGIGGTYPQERYCNSPAPSCGGSACGGGNTQNVGCTYTDQTSSTTVWLPGDRLGGFAISYAGGGGGGAGSVGAGGRGGGGGGGGAYAPSGNYIGNGSYGQGISITIGAAGAPGGWGGHTSTCIGGSCVADTNGGGPGANGSGTGGGIGGGGGTASDAGDGGNSTADGTAGTTGFNAGGGGTRATSPARGGGGGGGGTICPNGYGGNGGNGGAPGNNVPAINPNCGGGGGAGGNNGTGGWGGGGWSRVWY